MTADIVVGLGWGDEGKGATVDLLSATADRVVRFNGGQQAAHNVVAGGRHHTFQSFGSGSMRGLPTYIGPRCTIEPLAARREQAHIGGRIVVHGAAKVTTALHVALNRAKEEARGAGRHGSTGRGFGETIAWEYHGNDPLRARHLYDVSTTQCYIDRYAEQMGLDPIDAAPICEAFEHVFDVMEHDEFIDTLSHGRTVFEGAQGFMLDENFGASPHTTWSTTTAKWAQELAQQAGIPTRVVGALRSYATRHGAGPLPGEPLNIPEQHNGDHDYAGSFRTATWDVQMLKWSLSHVKPDVLALNHCDVFDGIHTSGGTLDPEMFGQVAIRAYGPDRADRVIL